MIDNPPGEWRYMVCIHGDKLQLRRRLPSDTDSAVLMAAERLRIDEALDALPHTEEGLRVCTHVRRLVEE